VEISVISTTAHRVIKLLTQAQTAKIRHILSTKSYRMLPWFGQISIKLSPGTPHTPNV